ncbi:MAG TPA: hypothetical protein PLO16_15030 [Acidocella sp.]|nr:hypothetical protein [Acidocella sp.]
MKNRTALFEFGRWYGLGLTPAIDTFGQRVMFRWFCVGPMRFEVWAGSLMDRLKDRLPACNDAVTIDNLRDEIAERDFMIQRQADRIAQLEFELPVKQ